MGPLVAAGPLNRHIMSRCLGPPLRFLKWSNLFFLISFAPIRWRRYWTVKSQSSVFLPLWMHLTCIVSVDISIAKAPYIWCDIMTLWYHFATIRQKCYSAAAKIHTRLCLMNVSVCISVATGTEALVVECSSFCASHQSPFSPPSPPTPRVWTRHRVFILIPSQSWRAIMSSAGQSRPPRVALTDGASFWGPHEADCLWGPSWEERRGGECAAGGCGSLAWKRLLFLTGEAPGFSAVHVRTARQWHITRRAWRDRLAAPRPRQQWRERRSAAAQSHLAALLRSLSHTRATGRGPLGLVFFFDVVLKCGAKSKRAPHEPHNFPLRLFYLLLWCEQQVRSQVWHSTDRVCVVQFEFPSSPGCSAPSCYPSPSFALKLTSLLSDMQTDRQLISMPQRGGAQCLNQTASSTKHQ